MTYLLSVTFTLLLAQSPAPTLSGTVWDDRSGAPIPGALVELVEAGRRTRSDSLGRYELAGVPSGTQLLRVTRSGYDSRTLRVLLTSAGELEVDVSLEALPARLASMEIIGRPVFSSHSGAGRLLVAPIGWRALTYEQVRAHPLLAEPDFMLALDATGGAAIAPESPTTLHVRGGASDQNLVLIDGVPIYSPVHASGSFGALNPDALQAIELHGGVAPARLGGALSGVVEAHSREPSTDGLRARGGTSLTSTRVTLEGPLARGVRFLISGRRGAPSLFARKPNVEHLRGSSSDHLAKLTADLAGGTVAVLSVSAADRASFSALSSHTTKAGSSPELESGGGLQPDNAQNVTRRHGFEWGSRSRGLSWSRRIDEGADFAVQLWQADYEAEIDWSGAPVPLTLTSARASTALESGLTITRRDRQTRFGFEIQRHRAGYAVHGAEASAAEESSYRLDARMTTLAAYVDDAIRLGERWEFMAGARGVVLSGRTTVLEPRTAIRFRPLPSTSLALGYARTHQAVQSLRNSESLVGSIFGADLPIFAGTPAAPVARADQLAVALEIHPLAGVRVALDGYARRMDRLVLVAPDSARPFAVGGFETGRGRVSGFTFTTDWERGKVAASSSLGISSVVTRMGQEVYQPSHVATDMFAAGIAYHPSPRTTWRAALVRRSGRQTTRFEGPLEFEGCNALDGGCEIVGTPERTAGPIGAERLPAYVRVDVGARRAWHAQIRGLRTVLEAHVTLSNILDRRNVWAVLTEPNTASALTAPMRPFSVFNAGIDWRY